MSDQLKNPNLPAHAIVEVRDDGSAVRNDGVELQAANSNPWYVLATVFGEQAWHANRWKYDKELAAQNRRAWNGWACAGLKVAERQDRADKVGLKADDLKPLTRTELEEITRQFQNRMGKDAQLPERTEQIDFANIYFSNTMILRQFIFEKETFFGRAEFVHRVFFNSAIFVKPADFVNAVFNEFASFKSATFNDIANFKYVTFNDDIWFKSAIFKDITFFNFAMFKGCTFFHSATFEGITWFKSATFKSTTRFDDAKFVTQVPEFYAAKLYEETIFPTPDNCRDNSNYRDHWPPLSRQVAVAGQDEPIDVMPAADQKRAYNQLRLFMSQALQFDEEQFFHRQEMRCKKEAARNWLQRWLFGLYEAVSDYGNSVFRPAACLAVVWVWGAVAKLQAVGGGNYWPDYHSTPSAMGWSLSNMFPFLGFWRHYSAENLHLNTFLLLIGGAQTISGFALLFLLGLGLRNVFRLR